ncbi:MAG TPA: serine/threonine-protein kinase, partial [Polyangiaceae bacterium]|nr:serine/threonine-protein kinase [Polyangiaceae bacterium]
MTEDASSSLQVGDVQRADRLKGFTLQGVLGSGGFGTVYAAMPNEPPHVLRAIKILDPLPFAGLEDGRQRFLREVEATGRLSHRAIVPLIGAAFTDDNVPCLVMELVQGKALRDAVGAMSFADRVRAMLEVLGALQYAHEQGVFHRDVRPSNVMVRDADGQVLLLDFGSSYVWEGTSSLTLTEQAVGSLGYIPPEVQADPRLRRPTHDVYSSVVMLYELLAGRRPDPLQVQPLAAVDAALAGLDAIVKKGLAAESARYAKCSEVASDLEGWLKKRSSPPTPSRSKLTDQLRQQMSLAKHREDQQNERERALREGLKDAMSQVIELIGSAAQAAMKELAELLEQTYGGKCEVKHLDPKRLEDGRTPHLLLTCGSFPSHTLVIASTAAFQAPLGHRSVNPLIRWADPATRRARRLPDPPHSYQPPFWIMYDDRGGMRSPPVVLRGGIAAYVTRIDGATSVHTMALHASDAAGSSETPAALETFDDIRDFWLRIGVAVF